MGRKYTRKTFDLSKALGLKKKDFKKICSYLDEKIAEANQDAGKLIKSLDINDFSLDEDRLLYTLLGQFLEINNRNHEAKKQLEKMLGRRL